MSLLQLMLKNLLRRGSRSLLTLVGVAIGIAAVVSLMSIAAGFEHSWADVYKARGTDLVVTKSVVHSAMPAPFSMSMKAELQAMPHVKEVGGLLSDVFSVEDSPSVLLIGWEPGTALWNHVKLEQGKWPEETSRDSVALGTVAAELLGKHAGSKVDIEGKEYSVTGIFNSSALAEGGAVVMPLPTMQALMDRDGMVNFFDVWLEPNTSPEETQKLRAAIKAKFTGLTAFDPGAVAQNSMTLRVAKAMSLETSCIALVVGAIGVMNTILMSVFERVNEIGVLLAIGWRRGRIMRMILGESLLLSFVGGVAGCGLGLAGASLLSATPWIRGILKGDASPAMLGTALLIALALGGLGGLYPAWIASKMSPATALRYQ